MDLVLVFTICFFTVILFIGIPIYCICKDVKKIKYQTLDDIYDIDDIDDID
jgi:hypothetical protein